jgi:hypothetical protein
MEINILSIPDIEDSSLESSVIDDLTIAGLKNLNEWQINSIAKILSMYSLDKYNITYQLNNVPKDTLFIKGKLTEISFTKPTKYLDDFIRIINKTIVGIGDIGVLVSESEILDDISDYRIIKLKNMIDLVGFLMIEPIPKNLKWIKQVKLNIVSFLKHELSDRSVREYPLRIKFKHVKVNKDIEIDKKSIISRPTIEYNSFDFNRISANLGAYNESLKLRNDIYNRVKSIIVPIFGDDKSMISEILRVTLSVIHTLIVKRDEYSSKSSKSLNESDIDVAKSLYVIACIHYLYNAKGEKKFGDGNKFFLDKFKSTAAQGLKEMNVDENTILKYYVDAVSKVQDMLDVANLETIEVEDDKIFEPKTTYSKSIYDKFLTGKSTTPLISFYNRATEQFEEIGTYIVHIKYLEDNKFLDYEKDKFYNYFTFTCPKNDVHTWPLCSCGLTKKLLEKRDNKYFNIYKTNFKLLKPQTSVSIFKSPKIVIPKCKLVSESELEALISKLAIKMKIEKARFYNISKGGGRTKQELYTMIDALPDIHRLKYYCLRENIDGSSNDYTTMLFNLLSKVESLKKLIKEEESYIWVDLQKLLLQKKILIEKDDEGDDAQNDFDELGIKIEEDEMDIDEIFEELDFDGDDGF